MAFLVQGLVNLVVPMALDGEPQKFGPVPVTDVLLSLVLTNSVCAVVGWYCHRSNVLLEALRRVVPKTLPQLRDEAFDLLPQELSMPDEDRESGRPVAPRGIRKRTAAELLFIVLHNGSVSLLAALAWLLHSKALALHAFTLEIAYEVFDTFHLGPSKLEPENIIHHIVSPICILCSTQTDIDFRVLCHLCICIDLSGAILGYSKFLLRFSNVSCQMVYRRLFFVYLALRVIGPYGDTIIIVVNSIVARGGRPLGLPPLTADGRLEPFHTDFTQLYFWAMAVLNAFNGYFCFVIHARSKMRPEVLTHYESTGCH